MPRTKLAAAVAVLSLSLGLGLETQPALAGVGADGNGEPRDPGIAKITFHIPQQALNQALNMFAQQAALRIVFDTAVAEGVMAPELNGEHTARNALEILLAGSRLTYVFLDARTVAIDAPAKIGASSPGPVRLAQAESPSRFGADSLASTFKEGSEELLEVLVTGTRLRTTDAASPSPIIVITQEDIKQQGLSTLEDVIRSLPQNFSTINGGSTSDNFIAPAGSRGQSTADLRGLGAQNTLILVNGRRRAASTTFGSGAVNLNTIPIGAIERVEIVTGGASAVYGSDAIAGVINFILKKDYQGGETHLRQELGHNGGDAASVEQSLGDSWSSGNVTFSGRYARGKAVSSRRAGFTNSDFTSRGGDDWRSTQIGQPGVVAGLGSLPAGNDGANGIAGNLSPANAVPFDRAALPYDVVAATTELSFDLNAEQELNSWARAYGEVNFAKNTSRSYGSQHSVNFAMVPETNAYNDLGAPVFVSYVFGREFQQGGLLPRERTDSDQKSLGAVLGFKIALPRNWTLDVSGSHSREDAYFNAVRLDETLVAQRLSGMDAQGNPIPANQQLNLFGNGSAQSPAAVAGLVHGGQDGYFTDDYSTNDSALLTAQGTLLKLPGGAVQVATGGEFRREELTFSDNAQGDRPAREVSALFGELNIPLVGEGNRVPGVHAFNLYGAARWEEYPISGRFDGPQAPERKETFSKSSPKVGLSWHPWQALKIRGTYSKAFRAPQLSALFGSTVGPVILLPIVDPQNPGQGLIFPAFYFRANPELGPETSENYSVGLDWRAAGALRGLTAALTYDRIDFDNRIANSITLYGLPQFFTVPGIVERDANGQISRINIQPVNFGQRRSENIDAQIGYDLYTKAGLWTFAAAGTYALKLDDFAVPGGDPITQDGTQNGPERVKARALTSWKRQDYALNLSVNYSSSYTNTNRNSPAQLGPQPVNHYTTFDLTGVYTFAAGFSINAGVRNLTNERAPFFNDYVPWDPRRVDLRGRIFYLELTKKYDLLH